MKIIPENQEDITAIIAHEFRTFGGGHVTPGNHISIALQNSPAAFAGGVDVAEVVARVLELGKQINP